MAMREVAHANEGSDTWQWGKLHVAVREVTHGNEERGNEGSDTWQ